MRQGGFEAEISPEELFRQFFGGGGMGGFGSPFGMFENCDGFGENKIAQYQLTSCAQAEECSTRVLASSSTWVAQESESTNSAVKIHDDDQQAHKIPTHHHAQHCPH